ncbi:MAG: hypothetical protein CM1200mP2_06650 [Planctomycetaceae bacterium]|nr:MAG: hypothetical protein CM1200mP2_06650 [Planctomycetaceae bacterium]
MKFSVWLVGRGCRRLIIAMIVAVLVVSDLPETNRSFAGDAVPFARLGAQFKKSIRPLLGRYCLGCHSTQKKVGELDLEQFTTFAAVRKGTKSWLKGGRNARQRGNATEEVGSADRRSTQNAPELGGTVFVR